MMQKVMEIALKRSILIPSNELYSPVGGFYDYGPVGKALKRKIEDCWRDLFLRREGNFEIETVYILPEAVLKASGHLSCFGDPVVGCSKCGKKFRADHLLEEKGNFTCGGMKPEQLTKEMKEKKIVCPECRGPLGDVGWFNLMFKTNIGPTEGTTGYIRPETAQGIFLDFQRVFRSHGSKLPMGIAQIGKSFRNEISPRQGLVRLREFSQMELEYFFNPSSPKHPRFKEVENEKFIIYTREEQKKGSEKCIELTAKEAVERKLVPNEIMAYFMAREMQFYMKLRIPYDVLRFRHMLPEETPHYSGGNVDLEVKTSVGWVEVIGNAYRTDYDLKSHSQSSGKDLSVLLEDGSRVIPHVVEPSFGVDRTIMCMLEYCYREGGGAERRDWEWFDFPAFISPFEVAVLPLMKKDGLSERASEIANSLREKGFDVIYDETGSIGKRYARADEIGVPYCLTVDYDTLKDGTVTIRFRNDGKQSREDSKTLPEKLHSLSEGNVVCLP
ncbi:MAG: glycine--tRNA ligase [Candidatus Micrarchaeota archaeon]|nr:glycine--tRNA ligase [Candidatus Micrarchaeota archaeon]